MTATIGADALAVPVHTECDCGQTLHVTVHLNSAHLEQIIERVTRKVLADGIRRAGMKPHPRG